MTTEKTSKTFGRDAQPLRVKSDWHDADRQSARAVLRMGWARHVLDEEDKHPQTHSAARLRRAQHIVASLQNALS